MLGVAAAHVGAHIRPGAAPEARQVARRLDRPVRRRQQLERQRHGAAGDRRMPVEPEQFLHADRQHRRFAVVADRHAASRRRIVVGRRQAGDLALQFVRHQRHQAGMQRARIDAREGRRPRQERQQPVVERCDQRGIRHVGPGRAEPAMQPAQPMPQRLGFLAPMAAARARARAAASMIARSASAPVGAGSRRSPSTIAPSRSVSRTRTARFSRSNSVSFRRSMRSPSAARISSSRNRGGRDDAGVLRLALQIGDDEEFLAGQRIGGIEHRAAPVRQHEAPALAARHGDAIRPGMDQQGAGVHLRSG